MDLLQPPVCPSASSLHLQASGTRLRCYDATNGVIGAIPAERNEAIENIGKLISKVVKEPRG